MERQKYISLVSELRQIAVTRAQTLLGNEESAEDVAEEILLKLWDRPFNLRDDVDEVRHLADKMARNLSLNQLRYRRRHSSSDIPDIPDQFTPHQYVEDKEVGKIVLRAMHQLPYNWRKIVEMREWKEMSFAEIAEVLGTTESSCRGMMSKARQRLLQLINEKT